MGLENTGDNLSNGDVTNNDHIKSNHWKSTINSFAKTATKVQRAEGKASYQEERKKLLPPRISLLRTITGMLRNMKVRFATRFLIAQLK